jgi:hypothetical protein
MHGCSLALVQPFTSLTNLFGILFLSLDGNYHADSQKFLGLLIDFDQYSESWDSPRNDSYLDFLEA